MRFPTTLLGIFALLWACSSAPTVIRPDGTKINLGASLFEDSKLEMANLKLPDGTVLEYQKEGKSQSKVPLSGIRTWGTLAGLGIVNDAMVATTAIPYKAATQQAGIQAGVEKAKVAADVSKHATTTAAEVAKAGIP